MRSSYQYALTVLFCTTFLPASLQINTNFLEPRAVDAVGTEFTIFFQENAARRQNLTFPLQLFLSTQVPEVVAVQVRMPLVRSPALHLREFLVTKGNVTEVNFPQSMMHTGSGKSNRGIHVISTAPIGIYGINTQRFSSEGFIAIPNHLLGTEYYAVGMAAEDQHSQVGIIAAERGITTVIITLPDDVDLQIDFEGRSYSANSVIVTSLKHFETLQLQHRNFKRGTPRGDISGARIQCTKRCSVFSGNSRTSVFGSSRDLLVEQLPPVSSWGTQFAVPSTPKRVDREDIIKIVCHQDGTHVLIDAVALQCNSGGSLQEKLNTTSFPHYIISTKPILVASIVLSQKAELAETLTDPAMTLIIPERQYAQVYTISTPRSSSAYLNGADYTNYLTLVIRKNNVHLLMMDGAYLDAAYSNIIWMDVPYTNTGGRAALSTAHIGIPPGTHTITTSESDATFMCIVSGSADRESYAYMAGMRLEVINPSCTQLLQSSFTDGLDNDCDGKVDEELCDHTDDDGDGRTDEDCAIRDAVISQGNVTALVNRTARLLWSVYLTEINSPATFRLYRLQPRDTRVLVADGENLRLTQVFSDPNKYNTKLYQPIRKGELFFIEVELIISQVTEADAGSYMLEYIKHNVTYEAMNKLDIELSI